jgi:Methyltransferase domain
MTRLRRYLRHGHRVHGWLDHYSATFIAELSRIQRDAGFVGGVGEVGVHMGRLFILLKLTAAPNEKTFAIDVFEDQYLNVDKSGYGDRATFLENVGIWTGDRSVEILQTSSLAVRPADILALVGPCRLVSIDGGHTAECVDSDLRLIESVLMPMGVALLDDFYNQAWPAVAAGGARYFFDPSTTLRPFAITPNKLFLANPAAHDFYHRAMRASQARWHDKTVEAFDSEIDVFGCDGPYHQGAYVRVRQAVRSRAQRLRALVAGSRPPRVIGR